MSAPKQLPFLPGHRFNDPYKQTYHKNQVFALKSSTCTGMVSMLTIRKSYNQWDYWPLHNFWFVYFNFDSYIWKIKKSGNKVQSILSTNPPSMD